MATLFGMFPFLKTLFADSGYQGPKFAKALAKVLPHLDIEIVKRSDQISGFVVLPKRWIVERLVRSVFQITLAATVLRYRNWRRYNGLRLSVGRHAWPVLLCLRA